MADSMVDASGRPFEPTPMKLPPLESLTPMSAPPPPPPSPATPAAPPVSPSLPPVPLTTAPVPTAPMPSAPPPIPASPPPADVQKLRQQAQALEARHRQEFQKIVEELKGKWHGELQSLRQAFQMERQDWQRQLEEKEAMIQRLQKQMELMIDGSTRAAAQAATASPTSTPPLVNQTSAVPEKADEPAPTPAIPEVASLETREPLPKKGDDIMEENLAALRSRLVDPEKSPPPMLTEKKSLWTRLKDYLNEDAF